MKNAYQILGVPPTAAISEIKDAYRKLSREWHPDYNRSPNAGQMFGLISEAYKTLSDPHMRQELDDKISHNLIEDINVVVEHVVEAYLETLTQKT